ncbi:transducin beta-like protein 2 isoform X5 [Onthophagus taurus]|uniref:transducin beta-like protein 2 isoform X5 n=1 Tax=Onthophagus taurus TaxID=166361 RepID=UPI000C2047AC|nr:transducin beta-like protein 2 isoform X5 [Onthophagus taurus]
MIPGVLTHDNITNMISSIVFKPFSSATSDIQDAKEVSDQKRQSQTHIVSNKKKKTIDNRLGRNDKTFTDKWLKTSMKGHTGQVLDMDYSSNGRLLASCSDDRTVILWDIKDINQKDRKSLRVNIEFDYPTFVKWSPDNKAFLITKYNENTVEVYKLEKKKDGWLSQPSKAATFDKNHNEDIIAMDIAQNGKFIMTCSKKNQLIVWNLKGQIMGQVDTYLMYTNQAKITPCSKFIVSCGFAPDVKVWEVICNKSGEVQDVQRVFELCGHKSEVYDVSFDTDTSHITSISKDGTWKLFDTKIDYKKGEDPHLKSTGQHNHNGPSKITLSPDAEVVVVSSMSSLYFYSSKSGVLDRLIENVYAGDVTNMFFEPAGKFLFTSGDKQVRVFHNVTGYKQGILTAKEKLKSNQTSATKERLEKLIQDNQRIINEIEN